jgi:hypothetical protein
MFIEYQQFIHCINSKIREFYDEGGRLQTNLPPKLIH